jgi:hypothetical protein
MRALTAIPSIALLVAVAGCGGGASKHYNASEVRGCLVDRNFSLRPADLPGDVAPDGSEGDLAVQVGSTEVDLAFGKDSAKPRAMLTRKKPRPASPSALTRTPTFGRRAMSRTG